MACVLVFWVWMAACARPPGTILLPEDTDTAVVDTAITDTAVAVVEDTGDADTDDVSPALCAGGMVPVLDVLGEAAFCIDVYENSLDDIEDAGRFDQGAGWPDGSTSGVSRSVSGVVPVVLVSWYQAAALCLNAGKHLCSTEEWRDGCDGIAGEGGSPYLWGDAPDEDVCVTLDSAGEQQWDSFQEAGSLERCQSPVGAYDMAGNVWEWTDSGLLDGGLPATHKVGGSYYSGQSNYGCYANPVTDHAPDFGGTIGFRCCASPLR